MLNIQKISETIHQMLRDQLPENLVITEQKATLITAYDEVMRTQIAEIYKLYASCVEGSFITSTVKIITPKAPEHNALDNDYNTEPIGALSSDEQTLYNKYPNMDDVPLNVPDYVFHNYN